MALDIAITVHPGDFLRTEIVEPAGLSITALAAHLGVTRQALSALLNSHAGLSAEMAIRFEKAFGIRADTLMRMQTAHELATVRSHARSIKVKRLRMAA